MGGAEDLRWGDGRIADGGRVVHMHVNGRVLCALCTAAAARQHQQASLERLSALSNRGSSVVEAGGDGYR